MSSNQNRIITKANRNLYQDQINSLRVLATKKGKSESEILREIIDSFLSSENAKVKA